MISKKFKIMLSRRFFVGLSSPPLSFPGSASISLWITASYWTEPERYGFPGGAWEPGNNNCRLESRRRNIYSTLFSEYSTIPLAPALSSLGIIDLTTSSDTTLSTANQSDL